MDRLKFDWDENKNKRNIRKHGVSFEEAIEVFYDPDALCLDDDKHSDIEDRFIMLGMSFDKRILFVCHCFRENETVIRIISARKASRKEIIQYFENVF